MAQAKISPEFEQRLASLGPADQVQAMLLLKLRGRARPTAARTTLAERQVIVGEAAAAADQAVPEIDRILSDHGGRRLAERVNALGSLPVETTPSGLRALAASGQVRAILEDQPVSLIH